MTLASDCQPADTAQIDVLLVGSERAAVIVIDGATTNPGALIDFAENQVAFLPVTDNLYPGLRAPMPLEYVRSMVSRLDPLIRKVYGISAVRLARAECFFSIVCTATAKLVPDQMLPHIDTSNPLHFATVHYLCPPQFGGTAFYRHLPTNFESILPEREPLWDELRNALHGQLDANAYPSATTPQHEQLKVIDADFDRLILYRSNMLHAGVIYPGVEHPADPRLGRLTATFFLEYKLEQ